MAILPVNVREPVYYEGEAVPKISKAVVCSVAAVCALLLCVVADPLIEQSKVALSARTLSPIVTEVSSGTTMNRPVVWTHSRPGIARPRSWTEERVPVAPRVQRSNVQERVEYPERAPVFVEVPETETSGQQDKFFETHASLLVVAVGAAAGVVTLLLSFVLQRPTRVSMFAMDIKEAQGPNGGFFLDDHNSLSSKQVKKAMKIIMQLFVAILVLFGVMVVMVVIPASTQQVVVKVLYGLVYSFALTLAGIFLIYTVIKKLIKLFFW